MDPWCSWEELRPWVPQGWMDVQSAEGSGGAQFSVQGCWWQIPFTTMKLDTTTLIMAIFQIKDICIICSYRKHSLNETDIHINVITTVPYSTYNDTLSLDMYLDCQKCKLNSGCNPANMVAKTQHASSLMVGIRE